MKPGLRPRRMKARGAGVIPDPFVSVIQRGASRSTMTDRPRVKTFPAFPRNFHGFSHDRAHVSWLNCCRCRICGQARAYARWRCSGRRRRLRWGRVATGFGRAARSAGFGCHAKRGRKPMTNVDGRPRASARRVVARSSFGILLLAVPAALHAQTASQITPPSYAPPVERRPEAPLALPSDIIRQAPPGSESLFVTLGDLTVSGGTLAPQTMAMLRSRLIGKRISVAQVFAAAQDAEASEARAGRVLVRVVVPQQDIADGKTLRLMVVEGFVESVDLSGVPKAVRARIAGLLAGLQDRRDVELAQLERKLTLAADTPGVTLRSALKPGKQPGGVVLQIAADWRPITGLASFDNSLPSALGRDSFGIGVNLNS